MIVSEGHLTQQYLCDYLERVEKSEDIHYDIVLLNLFLHRISVDGGFHARVVSSILKHEDDKKLLFALLEEIEYLGEGKTTLQEWFAKSYQSAGDERRTILSYIFRSTISGTNASADLFSSGISGKPESVWRLESRKFIVDSILNPSIFFEPGQRPVWPELPMDKAVAELAKVSKLSMTAVSDAIDCIACIWFTSLSRDEMIVWLNMPSVSEDEWETIVSPLFTLPTPNSALSTANWLYTSGNLDAAINLYANIAIKYEKTEAEKEAFEMIGAILREFGDYENAFEACKAAYLLGKKGGVYSYANGLKILCGAGEDLGEDMKPFYAIIENLKEKLTAEERVSLNFSLSALARRNHNYADECRYLEAVVAEESCSAELFSAVSGRLAMINSCLDESGSPDTEKIIEADDELNASLYIDRGDFAYYGFDPECALFWYNRALSSVPQIKGELSEKFFWSAVAAGKEADAWRFAEDIPARKAIVAAMDKNDSSAAIVQLNSAVNTLLTADASAMSTLIYHAFLLLSPSMRQSASDFLLNDRTTRDDEKSRIALAIGSAYLELGYANEAKAMYRIALRANPGTAIRQRVLIELAWAESECGNYKESVDICTQTIRLNERFPAAYSCMAKSYVNLGNFEEARTAAEIASSLVPTDERYQQQKEALQEICKNPKDVKIDTYFALPGRENLAYAAALYSNGESSSWNVQSVADVIALR